MQELHKKIDVLFVGGGTGGSVTPLIAVAAELPASLSRAWIGTRDGMERNLVTSAGIAYYSIHCGKFPRYLTWSLLTSPFLTTWGFFESLVLLRRLRPKVVVTAGSFVSVPVCWAAAILCIPYIVHQQDLEMGLANRLIKPWARKVTVVFDEQKKFFPHAEVIGNPIRAQLFSGSTRRAVERFHIPHGKKVVLVIGGGTGAQALNEWIDHSHAQLQNCFVIHATGQGKGFSVYEDSYFAQPFFNVEELADAFAIADVVVSRAGMGVISELGALGKPTILVPLAGHQTKNAEFLRTKNAVIVSRVAGDELTTVVQKLWSDTEAQKKLSTNFQSLFSRDSAQRSALVCTNILSKM